MEEMEALAVSPDGSLLLPFRSTNILKVFPCHMKSKESIMMEIAICVFGLPSLVNECIHLIKSQRLRWYEEKPLLYHHRFFPFNTSNRRRTLRLYDNPQSDTPYFDYPYYDDESRPTYDRAVTKLVELHSIPLKNRMARSSSTGYATTSPLDESIPSHSDKYEKPVPISHWAIVVGNQLYEGRRARDGTLEFCHYTVGSPDWYKNHWNRKHKIWPLGTTRLCHEQIINYGKSSSLFLLEECADFLDLPGLSQMNDKYYDLFMNNCQNFAQRLFERICPEGYFPVLVAQQIVNSTPFVQLAVQLSRDVVDFKRIADEYRRRRRRRRRHSEQTIYLKDENPQTIPA
ncbi:hypothetical protein PG989_001766 [Apiospora arundinis]